MFIMLMHAILRKTLALTLGITSQTDFLKECLEFQFLHYG